MTFFSYFSYTRRRVARYSKIEGLKGIMGCPKQESVSSVKGNVSPTKGETREN